ncbi:MAG: hypothetical protein LC650_04560 [Actinobacteria bacterium]|nr:hypothetical protein [Actinomycetota bacterium]
MMGMYDKMSIMEFVCNLYEAADQANGDQRELLEEAALRIRQLSNELDRTKAKLIPAIKPYIEG